MSTFFRVHSLAGIMRDKGAWPSQQDFVSPILTSLISLCCLEDRHNGRVCCTTRQLRSSSNLARYTWSYRLGVIIETLFHILDTAVVTKCLVPLSPRSALLRVVWTPILPNKPRPMTIHSQSVDGGADPGVHEVQQSPTDDLAPCIADMQFRLAFCLLPVRSRFWFLKKSNPHICLCVHFGCGAIETEKHLFFDCTLAVQL